VGALLDAKAVHTGRSAADHLRVMAATTGVGRDRIEEVIDLVGLRDVADKRAGGFSLGMGQRLGIASALLGDPQTLILDEPVNGLDPEGVVWIRTLLTRLAAEGRTVFLSSHLMSEMALTAEHLIVIGRGRLIRDMPVDEFIASASDNSVLVRSPDDVRLRELLTEDGVEVSSTAPGQLEVTGLTSDEIGYRAAEDGVTLLELSPVQASLEEAFMALTQDAVEYRTHEGPTDSPTSPAAP
jgi:ABC-2 type transport system ATP-binding protein